MILAAGHGTRLGDLGRKVPKVLIPVGGRTLLERHLEMLERHGFERVVVNTHHLAAHVEEFVHSHAGRVEVECLRERELLGTAGAVRNALPRLGTGSFLVLYGDVVLQDPLTPLIETHLARGSVATLSVHEAAAAEGKGVVEVDPTDRITGFVEKGAAGEGPFLINSGIYMLEATFVESQPDVVPLDFGRDVFPQALDDGTALLAHRLTHPVIDAGTPKGLALARSEAANWP